MRLGVVGDIHAYDTLLERGLGWLRDAGVDELLFVGDVTDGPGDLARCVTLLRDAGAIGVRGNHERWFLDRSMRSLPDAHDLDSFGADVVEFLRALPATRTIATPLGSLLLCHGMGDHDMGGLKPDDTGYALEVNDDVQAILTARTHAIVVAGHTHQMMVRRLGGITFVNAGALSQCVVLLDLAARRATFVASRDPSIVLLDAAL